VLLSLCAFFIITEGLPTGYLLPISFFSQRLLMPAERIRQVSLIYRIFTFAAMNDVRTTVLPADSVKLPVDGLKFAAPLKVNKNKAKLLLSESFQVKAGQLLAITGGTGLGKSSVLEAVLGIQSIEEGRIDLVSRNKVPWEQIRYLNQHDLLGGKAEMSFYLSRLMHVEQILANPEGQLIVLDDPLMGMDGLARQRVIELIQQAKRLGAVLVVSTNDRQIVSIAERWLSIQDSGEMQLRQLESAA
jgi:ABC-type protease/lipase transport system fused ATPase/permease subunit